MRGRGTGGTDGVTAIVGNGLARQRQSEPRATRPSVSIQPTLVFFTMRQTSRPEAQIACLVVPVLYLAWRAMAYHEADHAVSSVSCFGHGFPTA